MAKSINSSVNRMKLEAFLFFTSAIPKKELALNADLVWQLLFASLQKYDRDDVSRTDMYISCVENFNHGVVGALTAEGKNQQRRATIGPMNPIITRIIEMRKRKICKLQIV